MHLYLLKWLRTAETEDQKMSVGICAGKSLAIRSKLAVKNGSVTLTFNLETTQPRDTNLVKEQKRILAAQPS